LSVCLSAVAKGTITLRERDTTQQRIGSIDQVIDVISQLEKGSLNWKTACDVLPEYSGEQDLE
jgi:glycyl-tRNA synthetase